MFLNVSHSKTKRKSKHTNRARDEEHDDAERNEYLQHGETFCPSGEKRRVGGTESRTVGERHEKIIDETRPPSFARKPSALAFLDLHLWKKKATTAKLTALLAERGPAAIEPPIPKREDKNIRDPKLGARQQQRKRCFLVRRQGRHQKNNRSD